MMVGLVTVHAVPAFGSPVGVAASAPAGQTRKTALPHADLWCHLRPTVRQISQRSWTESTTTLRPKWVVAPRWPQLFADGRQGPLSLDPILRRHWWD